MCITLLSSAHPHYPFILLSNRDEFLTRPTARAAWWTDPDGHVLAGRDLEREERGTWLGMTTDGRIAVLTNFREEGVEVSRGKSRGGIVNAWLKPSASEALSSEAFAQYMIDDFGVRDVGGFSLIYGRLGQDQKGLSIISNRSVNSTDLTRICSQAGETHGLSNSHYGDFTWPKVVHGELMLKQAIEANLSRGDDQAKFIRNLFDVLSVNTMPARKDGEDLVTYMRQLRNSIFIPQIGGEAVAKSRADALATGTPDADVRDAIKEATRNVYGTQKQTVILVNTSGKVTWTERTLYDNDLEPLAEELRDVRVEFSIKA